MTCEYYFEDGACIPKRVHTVVVSVQHSDKITLEALRSEIMEKVFCAPYLSLITATVSIMKDLVY